MATQVQFLNPIDLTFSQTVQAMLSDRGRPPDQKLKLVGEQVIQWMVDHGRIVRAKATGEIYYLWRDQNKVYKTESTEFKCFLYLLTSINPSSNKFDFIMSDITTAGLDGETVEVVKLAYWDGDYLRVSRFDGTVLRLDGMTIETESNGDGPILFDDNDYEPYVPDLSSDGSTIEWWLSLLNAEVPIDQYRLGLLAYAVAMFMTELCPTRPILLLKGEKGSGKSMVLRLLLKWIFGHREDVIGVPDREEGFTTTASNSHVICIDNLDVATSWLRDKLARITTGAVDTYRILYRNNEMGRIIYRVWIMVTARTPDTLRRDDLADRLLIIPTLVLSKRIPEKKVLRKADKLRSQFWGDMLQLLNRLVGNIRAGLLPEESDIRMADFEVLGRLLAQTEGLTGVWSDFVTTWASNQGTFVLEESVICDAIEQWLLIHSNRQREVDVRTLYLETEEQLFGSRPNKPDQGWPKSSVWFGRQMSQLRGSLQSRMKVSWRMAFGRYYYTFDVL